MQLTETFLGNMCILVQVCLCQIVGIMYEMSFRARQTQCDPQQHDSVNHHYADSETVEIEGIRTVYMY